MKLSAVHNLQVINPKLSKEWHPTKNRRLTAMNVTPGSNKKVWWKCRKGHGWRASVYSRNKGRGCPYCNSKFVCKDNCLETLNPILAKEWHPTKNGKLTPKDVTIGCDKEVWWKCNKGHEWMARIYARKKIVVLIVLVKKYVKIIAYRQSIKS